MQDKQGNTGLREKVDPDASQRRHEQRKDSVTERSASNYRRRASLRSLFKQEVRHGCFVVRDSRAAVRETSTHIVAHANKAASEELHGG